MSQILSLLHSWLANYVSSYRSFWTFYSRIPLLLTRIIIYLRNNFIHQDSSIVRNIDPSGILSIYWKLFSCSILYTLVSRTDYPVWYQVSYEALGNNCMCDSFPWPTAYTIIIVGLLVSLYYQSKSYCNHIDCQVLIYLH